jgi:hypothetical protein
MKKNAFILFLLFTIPQGMIYSQTMLLPTVLTANDNSSNVTFTADPLLPAATPADIPGTQCHADKLTMTSSPNPFVSQTVITCFLPSKGKLMLAIRNMFGETIKTIEDNIEQPGNYSLELTSEHFKPGIYTAMLVLKTGDNVMMKTIRIVCNQ